MTLGLSVRASDPHVSHIGERVRASAVLGCSVSRWAGGFCLDEFPFSKHVTFQVPREASTGIGLKGDPWLKLIKVHEASHGFLHVYKVHDASSPVGAVLKRADAEEQSGNQGERKAQNKGDFQKRHTF